MRTVFFDLDGTLLLNRQNFTAVFVRVLSRCGVAADRTVVASAVETCWRWYEDQVSHFCGREMQFWRAFNTQVAAELVEDPKEATRIGNEITRTFQGLDYPLLYPDVIPCLDALQERQLKLGVITARPDARRVLQPLGILDRFYAIYDGFSTGLAKLDARTYALVLEREAIGPENVVHVGDEPRRDIFPAQAVGIYAILINRYNKIGEANCPQIASLSELPELLVKSETP